MDRNITIALGATGLAVFAAWALSGIGDAPADPAPRPLVDSGGGPVVQAPAYVPTADEEEADESDEIAGIDGSPVEVDLSDFGEDDSGNEYASMRQPSRPDNRREAQAPVMTEEQISSGAPPPPHPEVTY